MTPHAMRVNFSGARYRRQRPKAARTWVPIPTPAARRLMILPESRLAVRHGSEARAIPDGPHHECFPTLFGRLRIERCASRHDADHLLTARRGDTPLAFQLHGQTFQTSGPVAPLRCANFRASIRCARLRRDATVPFET